MIETSKMQVNHTQEEFIFLVMYWIINNCPVLTAECCFSRDLQIWNHRKGRVESPKIWCVGFSPHNPQKNQTGQICMTNSSWFRLFPTTRHFQHGWTLLHLDLHNGLRPLTLIGAFFSPGIFHSGIWKIISDDLQSCFACKTVAFFNLVRGMRYKYGLRWNVQCSLKWEWDPSGKNKTRKANGVQTCKVKARECSTNTGIFPVSGNSGVFFHPFFSLITHHPQLSSPVPKVDPLFWTLWALLLRFIGHALSSPRRKNWPRRGSQEAVLCASIPSHEYKILLRNNNNYQWHSFVPWN